MTGHTCTMADVKYLFLATLIIFLMELVTRQLREGRKRDFAVTALCGAINMAVTRPLSGALVALVLMALLPGHAGALSRLPGWITFPTVFILLEFSFYWVHRWSHEGMRRDSAFSWLWPLHRTHHSAHLLDVSVTLRQNIFWAFVVPNSWIIGVATYLGLGQEAAISTLLIYGWNLLTHTHSRWDDKLGQIPLIGGLLRTLQHIVVTPSMHHTHHGFGGKDGKSYRNYAVFLAAFDWMFGTLHIPEGRPARYGVPGPDAHWTEEAFYPLTIPFRKIGELRPALHQEQRDQASRASTQDVA